MKRVSSSVGKVDEQLIKEEKEIIVISENRNSCALKPGR